MSRSVPGEPKIVMVPVMKIRPNDYNPNTMPETAFAEYVAEVRRLGRLPKPIVVRRSSDDDFEVVDGEHGLLAAKKVDHAEVPCEIIDVDLFEAMRQTYARNRGGSDNPLLLGRMFSAMMAARGLSIRGLAREINVSEATIRNHLDYVRAAELRSSCAGQDRAEEIAKLSQRQIQTYLDLGTGLGDAWLDAGAFQHLLDGLVDTHISQIAFALRDARLVHIVEPTHTRFRSSVKFALEAAAWRNAHTNIPAVDDYVQPVAELRLGNDQLLPPVGLLDLLPCVVEENAVKVVVSPAKWTAILHNAAARATTPKGLYAMVQAAMRNTLRKLKIDVCDVYGPQVADQCDQSAKKVVIEVQALDRWPDEARYRVLSLLGSLSKRCRLAIGGETYSDPFEGILAAIKGPKSMEAHRQSVRAAIEAASMFYGDMAGPAAKRINDRLAEVGAPRLNHPGLVKQIRDTAGAGQSERGVDAAAAARMFLDHLAQSAAVEEGRVVLRYYQGDFYRWAEAAWERQADACFAAEVMQFLQTQEIPHLTQRFLGDVLAHLKGLAVLRCWNEPMPFLVAQEDPLSIERPRLIVFRNGAVDLEALLKGGGEAPSPVDSRYFHEIVLPYDFRLGAKCPLWLQTLKQILPKTSPGDRRREVLQEFFGYTLLQDCRFEKMLVGFGEGGNGKSTIIKTWKRMLGEQNCNALALEVLGNEYRAWELKGKLANFSGELNYLGKFNEGLLKQIISGEEITVNRKFKDPAQFRPFAKLVVGTNSLPQIHDPTQAIWDRIILMVFEVCFRDTDKDDKQLAEKLQEELPGIFLWAVVGLKRLLKQGRFTWCAKCGTLLDQYRTDSDSVRQFFHTCCTTDPAWVVFSEPLYQLYRFYATSTARKAVSNSEFGKRMLRLGCIKGRETKGQRRLLYKGVRLTQIGVDYENQAEEKHAPIWITSCPLKEVEV